MLTEKQQSEYIENGGNACPFCGEGNFDCGSIDIEAGFAFQNLRCSNCNRSWHDIYTLTGVEEEESYAEAHKN